jgi:probable rRNA maturation factor
MSTTRKLPAKRRAANGALRPLDLNISATSPAAARLAPMLRRNLLKAHQLLKSPLRDLSVALVCDSRMGELHHEFLGITGPTDVLTFELEQDSRGRVTSGEIVVCVPVARRQVKRRGGSFEHEVLLYALHGLLHLCGFDDRTDSDYQVMHRREDHILAALGIGPVFNSPPAVGRPGAD